MNGEPHRRGLYLIEGPVQEDWMESALCRGSDVRVFFPGRHGDTAPAKRICAACQVREECLEAAVIRGERHGVWGGATRDEIAAIRRRRKLSA